MFRAAAVILRTGGKEADQPTRASRTQGVLVHPRGMNLQPSFWQSLGEVVPERRDGRRGGLTTQRSARGGLRARTRVPPQARSWGLLVLPCVLTGFGLVCWTNLCSLAPLVRMARWTSQ
jgi:hypothetical protein